MMDYKVAVIIPTLNEEKFIARCLDSIICQSYPFKEMDVMVVDGGSKDRTRALSCESTESYSLDKGIVPVGKIITRGYFYSGAT